MFPLVMGVLNVTPDSFSDGGLYLDTDAAIAHGHAMIAEGADVVDVGGESTRPGAEPVPVDEELRRVLPVVEALSGVTRVSIDTRKPEVAEGAIAAGATLVNDISASLDDVVVAAGGGVGWVAMHMQGEPRTMQDAPHYRDVVSEVRDYLVARGARARQRGVDEVWIDPGIGFGKTASHNLSILRHIDELVSTGFPVVVGASRKAFIGRIHAASDAGRHPMADDTPPTPVADRFEGSIATAVWLARHAVGMVRVHDVAATVRAISKETSCPG